MLNEPEVLVIDVSIKVLSTSIRIVVLPTKLAPLTVSCEPTVTELALRVIVGMTEYEVDAVFSEVSVAVTV